MAFSFPRGGRTVGTSRSGGRTGFTSKGAQVTFSVDGLEKIQDRLDRLYDDVVDEMYDALDEVMGEVLAESLRLCPVDTGFLRSSAFKEVRKDREGYVRATIGYRAWYSVFVHERLDIWHKPPTQAKFLETPLAQYKPNIASVVGERARGVLRASR